MKRSKIVKYLLIVLPILIGIGSSILTRDMMIEYGSLNKPTLSPPAIIFPIAWSILYLLMGIASAIVYSSKSSENRTMGLILHFIQLVFNFFWSIIFFNMQQYMFAFIWLVLLFLTVLSMTLNYRKVNLAASLMNIPYLAWLTFAAYLNIMVYILN